MMHMVYIVANYNYIDRWLLISVSHVKLSCIQSLLYVHVLFFIRNGKNIWYISGDEINNYTITLSYRADWYKRKSELTCSQIK